MSHAGVLSRPFFGGIGTSDEVPGKWHASVNGLKLMFETAEFGGDNFTRSRSIPLLKPQSDTSGVVAEHSLNPEDFARSGQETWHHGAGQSHRDLADSDPARFNTSKGIDPSTMWKATLHYDTRLKHSSANVVGLAVAGTRLYFLDSTALKYTTSTLSAAGALVASTVTGTPGTAGNSIATNGHTVWTTHGANGLYATTKSTTAANQVVSDALDSAAVVGYVKGRLMLGNLNSLYNITAAGPAALPTALFTHPNTDFRFVGFADGPAFAYAVGYSGDRSIIYKLTIKTDGTGLDVPIVAGELYGETVQVGAVTSRAGKLIIGTDKGARACTIDDSGNVLIGDLIETTAAVTAVGTGGANQARFVWYGLTNFDSVSTGLGRMNLREYPNEKVDAPAYFSDLMATGQGAVTAIASFQNLIVFVVSGLGLYAQSTERVSSGYVDSGLVTYDLPDPKVAIWVDSRHAPLVGTVTVALSSDSGGFVQLGSINETSDPGATSVRLPAGQSRAEKFEVRHTLARSSVDTTDAPELTRWVMEANPAPGRGAFFTVAFRFKHFLDVGGSEEPFDVETAFATLLEFERQASQITYQDVWGSETVTLDDHSFIASDIHVDHQGVPEGFDGTFVARFRLQRQRSN